MLDIPAEEIFFFFVQTYITSTLYALASKPVVHAVCLPSRSRPSQLLLGLIPLASALVQGVRWIHAGGKATYLGLILAWATPFLCLLWTVAYSHILRLPTYATVWPIVVPTLYLWILDTVALRRGQSTHSTGLNHVTGSAQVHGSSNEAQS